MAVRRLIVRAVLLAALATSSGALTTVPARSAAPAPAQARISLVDPADGTPDDFFGLTRVHIFEISIAAADFARMPPPGGRGGRGMGRGSPSPGDDSGYPKVPATLRVDGRDWGALAIRYKGNSSYRGAPSVLKRSLKLDFDDPDKTRTFFGMPKLNLNNNAFDASQMRETLAYEVFRGAGVPAPRTAFARVFITVPGVYQHEYAGLFTAIEQIDQAFFTERWGGKTGVLLKPEGLRGLPDLGTEWKAYEEPYASKITPKHEDAARFIAFVRFVDGASDEEFARRIGQYLDVEEFLRFLAVETIIVNTDSPLAMDHNYWLALRPDTHRVAWIPWDMNMAFGGFMSGDADLSIRQPSAPGVFPLADRILQTPALAAEYERIVRQVMQTTVTEGKMNGAVQDLATAIRPAVGADPAIAAEAFARQMTAPVFPSPPSSSNAFMGPIGGFFGGRAGPPLRQFIADRILSVNEQLAGKRAGTPGRAGRGGGGGRFGFPPPPPRGR